MSSVNKLLYEALEEYGSFTLSSRVYRYLGSLGYTGTLSDRLAQHEVNGKIGWQAVIEELALVEEFSHDS